MKRLPYSLIVFDWDGTLMDSAAGIVGAMQAAAAEIGLPDRSAEQMRELIGLGMDEVLARLYPDMDVDHVRALLAAYRKQYGTPGQAGQLFPGVAETLVGLRRQGFELAVATGKSRHGLDRAMASTGVAELFAYSRCADESASKPAPDMLEDILLRAATPPEQVLMVGDTEYDMAMASSIGVMAVGVDCGVHDIQRMLDAGAHSVLDDVRGLPAWLRERGGDQQSPS